MSDSSLRRLALGLVALAIPATSWALPWHTDMADAEMVKAYEQVMRPLPEGVMSQDNLLTPISYRRNFVRESPEGQALANPYDVTSEAFLALGGTMYNNYCTPCHGDGVNNGPVAAPGRYPGVAVLAGENGRLQARTDGHVYLTIRNGGGIMPSYSWAMNDEEMWAIVAYMRAEFPNSAAPTPEPAEPTSTEENEQ